MSNRTGQLPDQGQRWQAITTPQHAFVWASAGTGKTHTLTLRALYLLLTAPLSQSSDGNGNPPFPGMARLYQASSREERLAAARSVVRSVVLTTFTRKAAAEMEGRLYRYLESVAFSSDPSQLETLFARDPLFVRIIHQLLERLVESGDDLPLFGVSPSGAFDMLRQGAQALAEAASELQVSTIHSLAATILRRHPLQAGIPPSVRFAREDEDELLGVEDQMVDLWWQRRVLLDKNLRRDLQTLLQVLSVRQIRDWLRLCAKDRWLAREVKSYLSPESGEMDRLLRACQGLLQEWTPGGGSKLERTRAELEQRLVAIETGADTAWSALCQFMKTHRSYLFLDRSPTKRIQQAIDGLPAESGHYFQTWSHFGGPAARAAILTEYRACWKVWEGFVQSFVQWVETEAIHQLGLVTFDEMIRLAVQLLERHPTLRRGEQGKMRALLVDEFQDTDPEQLRLFTALLRRDEEAEHEVLGFFVGDPKQSIYRFRGADVDCIEDFRSRYQQHTGCRLGHSSFRLQTSFRSRPEIITFVNGFFENELSLGAAEEALLPLRPPCEELPRWLSIIPTKSEDSLARIRTQAAHQTLQLIGSYVNDSPGEQANYRDILVLVKDWLELEALLPILHNAGIPTVSAGAKTFHRHPEVLDVLNLLIAMLHPGDRLAVASLLRSPIVLLSDTQIHRLLQEIPPARLLHSQQPLPESLPAEVQKTLLRLRQLVKRRHQTTSSRWLQDLRQLIPRPLYQEPGDCEGRPIARIDRVLGSFQQQVEMASLPPLVWLLEQRSRAAEAGRLAPEPGEDVSLADESVNAVRVMTVHKAKGLEGQLVIVYGWASILADLEGRRPGGPAPILRLKKSGRTVQGFALDWGPLQLISNGYHQALRMDEQNSRAETQRLAYVAATRAREKLVLLFPELQRSRFPEGIDRLLGEGSQGITEQGTSEVQICGGRLLYLRSTSGSRPKPPPSTAPSKWPDDGYLRLWTKRYAQLQADSPLLLERPSQPQRIEEDELTETEYYRGAGEAEIKRLAGALIHLYLERHLLESEYRPEQLARLLVDTVGAAWRNQVGTLADALLATFYRGELKDPSGLAYHQRVEKGKVRARELPFYLSQQGHPWHGVIDLVLEEENRILGVDYKTGSPLDPLPEPYRHQEQIYTSALEQIFPDQSVGFEFWWLG